eukprot:UN14043
MSFSVDGTDSPSTEKKVHNFFPHTIGLEPFWIDLLIFC